jgi:lysophospholipase
VSAEGPLGPGSTEFALGASDGVALRAAHLPAQGARRGRVALLHGRTEFLEKYIEVAAALSERGFDVVSTDWRGQGRSGRMLADARRGHVGAFADYQRDLKALLAAPEAQGDGPLLMLAHSMGGAIGLRALDEGHDFKAAIFSAPMWGVKLPLWAYPVARLIAGAGVGVGLAGSYAPGGGGATPYALRGFDDNLLTADREQFDRIADRTREAGEYALGGPTLGWLAAALKETAALRAVAPPVPSLALLGGDEAVVSTRAIREKARHPALRLEIVDGGRHELFFETPERRAAVWAAIDAFLTEAGI